MGEHRAVLLLAVGKAEHPPHVKLQLPEVRIQPVAADLLPVEPASGAPGNGARLLTGGHAAHDGEYLPGQHHAGAALPHALQRALVIVVVAVEPAAALPGIDPLLAADVLRQPVRHAVKRVRQFKNRNRDGMAADAVPAPPQVSGEDSFFALNVRKNFLVYSQQLLDFLQQLHGVPAVFSQQTGQLPEIPRIGAGERHAFAVFGSHIQGIVPVRAPQAENIVGANLIEGREMLNEQMLQDASQIGLARFGFLPRPAVPERIGVRSAHRLRILEIGSPFVQDIHISSLLNVQLQRHQRPKGVIHPNPGDSVAVRDKIPQSVANNGGIGAVNAHPAKIRPEHLLYTGGIHQQQGQAVLPQIPPAPASPAIVMVRKEGAAIDPPQEGLEADPAHKTVKVRIPGAAADIHFFPPVGADLLQRPLYLTRRLVGVQNSVDFRLILRNAQKDDVLRRLPRRQGDRREPDAAHGLPARGFRSRRNPWRVLIHRPGTQERPALANKAVCRGIKRRRVPSVSARSEDEIDPSVFPVSLLIKGHGGLHQHPVIRGPDTVEHGGHIPVIPNVVRAPAVDRNRRDPGEPLGRGARIGDADIHDLHVLAAGDKGCDLRAKRVARCLPADALPHKSRRQPALVLHWRKAGGLLFRRHPGGRPAALFRHAPEVSGAAAGAQVFGADRLQQKALLVQLAVAAQVRSNGAFQPCFTGQREIEAAYLFRIVNFKDFGII